MNVTPGTRWRAWARRAAVRLAVLAIALPLVGSCGKIADDDAASYLVIGSLYGRTAGGTEQFVTVLQSDVLSDEGTIFEDLGTVVLRIALKDPGIPQTPTIATTMNEIFVYRYRVVYKRADGRNTPGVDVPHPFDAGMSFTVERQTTQGGGQPVGIVLVRAQAKLEPPLMALARGGGAISIATIAEVTFYGRDGRGREVSATGTISVNFADWAG